MTSGGMEGPGSNAMSRNGRALGSDGRCSIGSMVNFDEGRMYPDVECAGARTEGSRPLRMLLVCSDLANAFALKRVVSVFVGLCPAGAELGGGLGEQW